MRPWALHLFWRRKTESWYRGTVSLMPEEPFKTILEAYGMHDFCTGPEGLEPSTSCSAGSHSIQAELWTPCYR